MQGAAEAVAQQVVAFKTMAPMGLLSASDASAERISAALQPSRAKLMTGPVPGVMVFPAVLNMAILVPPLVVCETQFQSFVRDVHSARRRDMEGVGERTNLRARIGAEFPSTMLAWLSPQVNCSVVVAMVEVFAWIGGSGSCIVQST